MEKSGGEAWEMVRGAGVVVVLVVVVVEEGAGGGGTYCVTCTVARVRLVDMNVRARVVYRLPVGV